MKIFAIDSSGRAGSAALSSDGVILAESYCDIGLTHSETLMVTCDEVFRRTGLAPSDIDYYAVTAGPGSFTGLRIGMGIIKGLAFIDNKPCVAVSSLEAVAYNVVGTDRTAVAVSDARRGRVYTAAFEAARGIVRLSDDGIEETDKLSGMYSGKKIILIGDAAAMCYNILKDEVDCTVAAAHMVLPHAAGVACAAKDMIARGHVTDAYSLKPNYLQLCQAERELQNRKALE